MRQRDVQLEELKNDYHLCAVVCVRGDSAQGRIRVGGMMGTGLVVFAAAFLFGFYLSGGFDHD